MDDNVTQLHPALTAEYLNEVVLMRDAVSGESAIKGKNETYLPRPSGFAVAANGTAQYLAYKTRAQFPEILAPSVSAMIGIGHGKEISIQLPDAMAYLYEDADGNGMPLDAFHRAITRQLLITGRYGVLADAPEAGGEPFLVGYVADAVINWDRDFYVLDESGWVRDRFKWAMQKRHRVLEVVEGRYVQTVYIDGKMVADAAPTASGAKSMAFVPFVVANAREVSAAIETPPLIGVARAALAIYQLSADYRWQLFMSGQETLVAINGEAPTIVGAGVVHRMMGGDGNTPDLKYVSPSCAGIDAHAAAMQDNRTVAVQAGARLLEQSDQVQESGSARKLRFASETATLGSIMAASCGLLERALRFVAMMKGLKAEDVIATAPKDLLDNSMTPADAEGLVRVWQAGAISFETLYENLQDGGIASADRDYDDEMTLIDAGTVNDGQADLPMDQTTDPTMDGKAA